MQLLDGKATAKALKDDIAAKVADIKSAGGKVPHLAAVLVGNDGGSKFTNAVPGDGIWFNAP